MPVNATLAQITSRKTKEQKLIEHTVREAVAAKQGVNISNSQFYGAHFDAKAMDTIETIGQALIENAKACGENAKALSSLAQVLKASNVEIECLLKISDV